MTKPNLFIVGTSKVETTSLHDYLNQHSDIYMSKPKEPHHFCKDLLEKSDNFHGEITFYKKYRTKKEYLKLFKNRKELISGEASVWYYYSKITPAKIKTYNPDAKIIIMLREPTTFLYSLHAEALMSQDETEEIFEKALELEQERKKKKEYLKQRVSHHNYIILI